MIDSEIYVCINIHTYSRTRYQIEIDRLRMRVLNDIELIGAVSCAYCSRTRYVYSKTMVVPC